jgi:phosphonate transport system substrate-binding protein
MKKIVALFLIIATVFSLAACGGKKDKTLVVYFVPSRDASKILEATEPLKGMLKEELSSRGYDFDKVDIQVGASYEAVSEALSAGTADVGFIPGGTYAAMGDDEASVILTATRYGLSKDSSVPTDWNDGLATENDSSKMVNYYKGLIVAGPSTKGQALADIVNAGNDLTWNDIKDAKWCVQSTTSSSGYIYPTLWLNKNFDHTIGDITTAVQTTGYGDSMTKLAGEQCDVSTIYADARMQYADKWTTDYNRTDTIWEETNVIGVTDDIFNDTISVTGDTSRVDSDLIKALQESFIAISKTTDGQKVIDIYSHKGYVVAKDSDYDNERAAQELIKSLSE